MEQIELHYTGNNFIIEKNLIDPCNKHYENNIQNINNEIKKGNLIIIKEAISQETIFYFRNLCSKKLINPIDQYYKLERNIPNNIRCHIPREESIVPVRFNAYNFYPWNTESNEVFKICKNLYLLRTKMVQKDYSKFFNDKNSKFTARLALQFYPLENGFFSSHRDPYDYHQIAIPTISLSHYGKDFDQGGFFLLDKLRNKHYIDKLLKPSDAILFHSCIEHGVDHPKISSKKSKLSTKNIQGRLMLLCAINSFA